MYISRRIYLEIEGVIFFLLISLIFGDISTESQNQDAIMVDTEIHQNTNPEPKYVPEGEEESEVGNIKMIELPSTDDHKILQVKDDSVLNEKNDVEFIKTEQPEITSELVIPNNKDSQLENITDADNQSIKKENVSLREILKKLMKVEEPSVPLAAEPVLNASDAKTAEVESVNMTESNNTKTNSSQTKKAACVELEEQPRTIGDVEILNATALQKLLNNNPNITTRSAPAKCYIVYFFSPYCPFSTQGSAYVNALARSLQNIPVFGFDSIAYHSLNARYGIMGTPSLVLFHNGNVVGRYNASEFSTYYLEAFVHHFTDQKIDSINVTSNDFKANLPSQLIISPPYALYIAWMFLLTCGGYVFLNSEFYAKFTEAFVNNWREAEAQHEHDD